MIDPAPKFITPHLFLPACVPASSCHRQKLPFLALSSDFITDPEKQKIETSRQRRQPLPPRPLDPPRRQRGAVWLDEVAMGPVRSSTIAAPPPPCRARGPDPSCSKRGGALNPTVGATISTQSTTTAEAGIAFFSHAHELSRG